MIHATGTGALDELGGVARSMPRTAAFFLVGCVSICGLPPFNGFVSEWTVYRGLFGRALAPGGGAAFASVGGILALALIGGLAAACFAKVFGVVFLGARRQRTRERHDARGARRPSRAPWRSSPRSASRSGSCRRSRCDSSGPPLARSRGASGSRSGPTRAWPPTGSSRSPLIGALVIALAAGLAFLRFRLARRPPAPGVPTWGCGYSRPGPKLQYTASSFADPLLAIFRRVLFTRTDRRLATGSFPEAPAIATRTDDAAESFFFRPLFTAFARACGARRFLQRLPVQAQVFIVMLMLAVFLVWRVAL